MQQEKSYQQVKTVLMKQSEPVFHWDKCYLTGIPEVDDQHHRLVDLINGFGELVTRNDVALEDIRTLSGQLTDYTIYHFTEEEEAMRAAGIDSRHFDLHVRVHQEFVEDIRRIFGALGSEISEVVEDLPEFLTHWLAYHILGTDQNMARQIESINSGMSPANAFAKEEKSTRDSTEPLLRALNNLFYRVSSRNRELVLLAQSLEEKVKQRTSALAKANSQLQDMALTDTLTGLPNRRHGLRKLKIRWESSAADDSPLTCLMIDADHFKAVNDTRGHDAGDRVLVELARTLRHGFRNDDTVCRLGGDEFLVICPHTNLEGGVAIAETMRKTVSELKEHAQIDYWNSSISIGVACRSASMQGFEELINSADEAVYAAKKAGKNCVKSTVSDD